MATAIIIKRESLKLHRIFLQAMRKKVEEKKNSLDRATISSTRNQNLSVSSWGHLSKYGLEKKPAVKTTARIFQIGKTVATLALAGIVLFYPLKGVYYLLTVKDFGRATTTKILYPSRSEEFDRLEKKIEDYNKQLQETPRDIDKRIDLAAAYINRGLYQHALAQAQLIREIDQNRYESYGIEGAAYAYEGKYDKGMASFKKSISLSPKAKELHYAIAGLYTKKGNLDKAIEECKIALAIDPNFMEVCQTLGKLYSKKGNKKLAKEYLQKAADLGSKESEKYLNELKMYDK